MHGQHLGACFQCLRCTTEHFCVCVLTNHLQDPLTAEERQLGKRINFSVMYGAGARQLAGELGTSPKEAQRFMDRWVGAHTSDVFIGWAGVHYPANPPPSYHSYPPQYLQFMVGN